PPNWGVQVLGVVFSMCFLLLVSATLDVVLHRVSFGWDERITMWICRRCKKKTNISGTARWWCFFVLLGSLLGLAIATMEAILHLGIHQWIVGNLLFPEVTKMPQMQVALFRIFYERETSFGNGLSLVIPVVLLGAGGYLGSLCYLQRLRLL